MQEDQKSFEELIEEYEERFGEEIFSRVLTICESDDNEMNKVRTILNNIEYTTLMQTLKRETEKIYPETRNMDITEFIVQYIRIRNNPIYRELIDQLY